MVRLQMEVVAAMQRLLAVGGDIGAQMVLVGRLVVREPRVAIEAVGAVLDGEVGYGGVERGNAYDGLLHALFKVGPDGVILLFVVLEPLPAVVLRQLAQVFQNSFGIHF